MSVTVHPGRLRQELARRGWSAADLARHAGLSHPTVGAALAGRPIAAASLACVARALGEAPPIEAIDRLLFAPERELG